jgi:tetratricopeptide (TPR) repeat protein
MAAFRNLLLRNLLLLAIIGAGEAKALDCPAGYHQEGTFCVTTCAPGYIEEGTLLSGKHCVPVSVERPNDNLCKHSRDPFPVVIKSCTAAIDSKQFEDAELASLFRERADNYVLVHDVDRAVADYSEAISLLQDLGKMNEVDLASAFSARAEAYERKEDYPRALADYGATLKLHFEEKSVSLSRAQIYLRLHDCQHAIPDFENGQDRSTFETDPIPWFGLALCHAELGQFDRASDYCSEVRSAIKRGWDDHDPEKRDIWDSCPGMVGLKSKKYSRGLAAFAADVKTYPQDQFALYGRGMTKLGMGDRAGGEADVAAALAIDSFVADSFAKWGVP